MAALGSAAMGFAPLVTALATGMVSLRCTDACQCGGDRNNPHITWGSSYFKESNSDTE